MQLKHVPIDVQYHERTCWNEPAYEFTMKVEGKTFGQMHQASAVDEFGAEPFKVLLRAYVEIELQLQKPEKERTYVVIDNRE